MSCSRRYEVGMVALLGLAVGTKTFEQTSSSCLMPFIQAGLKITNTQVGLVVSVYYMAYAISSYLASAIADSTGRRKAFVVFVMASMSLCAIFSGLATSLVLLLAARGLMGLLEGPMLPITQTIIAFESPAKRRGANMGIVGSLFANIFGLFIAPLMLINLASHYSWRIGFFVVILPGLLCAILVGRLIREPIAPEPCLHDASPIGESRRMGGLLEALRFRNVWLCAGICCFFVGFLTIGMTFQPLFYVNFRHYSTEETGFLMSLMGVSSIVFAALVPMSSDRFGRKPVMVLANLLGMIGSLVIAYLTGPIALVALILFIAWTVLGTGSLLLSTVPFESVPARASSGAMGLVMAIGVLSGGLIGPTVAGWSADRWGLRAPLLLQVACAAAATILSSALRETAPCKMRETGAAIKSLATVRWCGR